MSWWLFCWCLLSAQASEMVLRYTTNLTDAPALEVEMLGRTESVRAQKVTENPPFVEWEMRWDSENAWVQHLHIQHPSVEEPVSTILMGPQQQGTVYLLNDHQKSRRQLLSDTGETQTIIANENRSFQHHVMWMGLVVMVLLLIRRSPIAETSESDSSTVSVWWQHPLASGGLFLLLSVWWQRSMLFTSGIPAQYHDALGTYWMMARAMTWDGLFDPMTVYPTGGDYRSLDSFVLWGLARLFAWMDPVWLYRGCLMLFPAISAWTADWWARDLGIRTPWSWVAGMLFGFSGLVENAILEGQVYQSLTVGLPLTGVFVGRYLRTPSWRHWLGVMSGFTLSLFSSSYLGASCLIVLFGLWIGTGAWRRLASLWIFLGVLPILWVHNAWMSAAGIHQVRELREMVIGSVSLTNFWGSTPELDREGHAIALGVSIVGLLLVTLVHRGRLAKPSWSSLLWMGGVSLGLMVGPTLNMSHLDTVLSLPNTWLYQQPGFSSIGFPIRLAHPFLLSVALLAALCTQQMAMRYRWAWLILPLVWADVERRELSERQGFWPIEVPVLNHVEPEESVFALYPLAYKRLKGSDADIILYMLDCMAQVGHQQPITNNCLSVNIHTSQTKRIQETLLNQMLARGSVTEIMRQHQLDVLIMYPELFSPSDRVRVQQTLQAETTLVEEGQTPLWYQVYRPAEIPQTVTTSYVPSEVTIDLITSKDESKPLLVLGDGVLMETTPKMRAQTVRHQVHLSNQPASFSLLFQNTSGETVWEGTLYPSAETDRFVVRPELGPQMELPIFSSPPALSTETQWVWLLFGGLLGSWLFVRRKDEWDAVM